MTRRAAFRQADVEREYCSACRHWTQSGRMQSTGRCNHPRVMGDIRPESASCRWWTRKT